MSYLDFEIDKQVPLPNTEKCGRPAKYPFTQMEVGDSVFFEGAKTGGKEYIAALKVGRYKGWKFSGRSVEGGIRIWRVE